MVLDRVFIPAGSKIDIEKLPESLRKKRCISSITIFPIPICCVPQAGLATEANQADSPQDDPSG